MNEIPLPFPKGTPFIISTHVVGSISPRFVEQPDGQLTIDANTDLEAIQQYLSLHTDSASTLRRYILEAERLLIWLQAQGIAQGIGRSLALNELSFKNIDSYLLFLQSPGDDWCAPRAKKILTNKITNPAWRPFVHGLTKESIAHSRLILKIMFDWLCAAGWLNRNIFILFRWDNNHTNFVAVKAEDVVHKTKQPVLDEQGLDAIAKALNLRPRRTSNQINMYERSRFIIHTLLYLTLKPSDLTKLNHDDFYYDQNNRLWLNLHDQSGKNRSVAIPDKFKDVLSRYRKHLNLPLIPTGVEKIPLIRSANNSKSIATRQIHALISRILLLAADNVDESNTGLADLLRSSPVRLIRRTSIYLQKQQGITRQFRALQARRFSDEQNPHLIEEGEMSEQFRMYHKFDASLRGLFD